MKKLKSPGLLKSAGKSTKFISLLLILLLVFSLGACDGSTPSGSDLSSLDVSSEISSEISKENSPVVVVDGNGKNIEIAEAPERIIALPVWASEILLDMVETDRIVGISSWGDSPAISATADKAALVAARVDSKNPEGIVALNPDLVILDSFNDFDGSLAKTLEEAGVVVLAMISPVNFEQIKGAIKTLAEATFARSSGDLLINDIDSTLNGIKEKVSTLSDEEKLSVMYFEEFWDQSGDNAGMLTAYGSDSPFDAIAKAAGLVNVCDLSAYSPVDRELIVGEWKPDVFVVPSMLYDENFAAYEDEGKTAIASIKNDSFFAAVPAVVNDRVFAIPSKYSSSTSHYMVKAAQELAELAYPQLFN